MSSVSRKRERSVDATVETLYTRPTLCVSIIATKRFDHCLRKKALNRAWLEYATDERKRLSKIMPSTHSVPAANEIQSFVLYSSKPEFERVPCPEEAFSPSPYLRHSEFDKLTRCHLGSDTLRNVVTACNRSERKRDWLILFWMRLRESDDVAAEWSKYMLLGGARASALRAAYEHDILIRFASLGRTARDIPRTAADFENRACPATLPRGGPSTDARVGDNMKYCTALVLDDVLDALLAANVGDVARRD